MTTPRGNNGPNLVIVAIVVIVVAVVTALFMGRQDSTVSEPVDAVPVPPAAQAAAENVAARMT